MSKIYCHECGFEVSRKSRLQNHINSALCRKIKQLVEKAREETKKETKEKYTKKIQKYYKEKYEKEIRDLSYQIKKLESQNELLELKLEYPI